MARRRQTEMIYVEMGFSDDWSIRIDTRMGQAQVITHFGGLVETKGPISIENLLSILKDIKTEKQKEA